MLAYLETMQLFGATLRQIIFFKDKNRDLSYSLRKRIEDVQDLLHKNTVRHEQYCESKISLIRAEIQNSFRESDRCAKALINEVKWWCDGIDCRYKSYENWVAQKAGGDSFTLEEAKRLSQDPKCNIFIELDGTLTNVRNIWDGYVLFQQQFDLLCENWEFGRPLGTFQTFVYVNGHENGTRIENRSRKRESLHSMSDVKTQQVSESKHNTPQPFNRYAPLQKYIDATTESIESIMRNKVPKDGIKSAWKGLKKEAIVFADTLTFTIPEMNRCFTFNGGKPLKEANRDNRESNHETQIYKTLKEFENYVSPQPNLHQNLQSEDIEKEIVELPKLKSRLQFL